MHQHDLTLEFIEPDKSTQTRTFDGPADLVVGRGDDCDIQLPKDQVHSLVSRHHCAFQIDPPAIRVRDLGSRNGTYLNGVNIGQRPSTYPIDDEESTAAPLRELHDGDEVRIGLTRIRVGVDSESSVRKLVPFLLKFVN